MASPATNKWVHEWSAADCRIIMVHFSSNDGDDKVRYGDDIDRSGFDNMQ
jgi:hypothetical protein